MKNCNNAIVLKKFSRFDWKKEFRLVMLTNQAVYVHEIFIFYVGRRGVRAADSRADFVQKALSAFAHGESM